ncbi:MAG TPA: bifunctional precorrin-2 dehydrogenase/sirohydrochlorin ferrochelatase [Desulfomicrobiaceae bacterium]|nr:bifunctional precorrin-2 dehydrogenase/sirohydrochlorin ferrochelatase [Desulfomicrobiaceae bacterium]
MPYPIFLDLSEKICLVAGAGEVGLRKIVTLLAHGPGRVIAFDPGPQTAAISALLAKHPEFTYMQHPLQPKDLDNAFLVFACTDAPTTNRQVADWCRERNILCNIADAPDQGSFTLPAVISRGDMTLAVSTSGASPALSKKIRSRLEKEFGPEYGCACTLLSRVRTSVLALGRPSRENRIIFRALADSCLTDLIRTKDQAGLEQLLKDTLPIDLHSRIGELCDDLFQNH